MKQCKKCGHEFEYFATREDVDCEGCKFQRKCCPKCELWEPMPLHGVFRIGVLVVAGIMILGHMLKWWNMRQ